MTKNKAETPEQRKSRLASMEYNRHYSFMNIWARRYADMKARTSGQKSKRTASCGKECLSKEDFLAWCTSQPHFTIFLVIYMDWQRSGFNMMLAPSVDRIDNDLGYIPENMQWVTFFENMEKHDKPFEGDW